MAKKQTEPKTVEIPPIEYGSMVVNIRGITPLITNRFRDDSKEQIEKKQQSAARMAKAPRIPAAEFQGALHGLANGGYGFPAVGIKNALVAAGGRFADETMTVLRGVLNIGADLVEIVGSEPEMRSDFVMLNSGKGPASIAYRPMFREWSMAIPIIFMSNMISHAQIFNLFQIAGFAVGIGAWRPEKRGTFGQFKLAHERDPIHDVSN